MVFFHLFFLLCTTIQPNIRVLIDLFLLFAHDPSTKMYGPLPYILPLWTIIRTKIWVLINLFLLFVHDHSTKIRGHLTYSFLNCASISYALFKAVLPSHSCQNCPYISHAIFMAIWSLLPTKILVPRLPQHTPNVNIECAGKSEWSKQLCSLYVTSFWEHWYNLILLFWY